VKTGDRPEGVGVLLRALSDWTRLRILHLLRGRTLRADEIAAVLQLHGRSALQQLEHLRRGKVVVARRAGKRSEVSLYTLAPPRDAFHGKLLQCIQDCLGDLPEVRADDARVASLLAAAPLPAGTTGHPAVIETPPVSPLARRRKHV
jgi:ArsR family transcriptional regulator, arsenate/arsenite/antimonite-responsive transcriptional repressor